MKMHETSRELTRRNADQKNKKPDSISDARFFIRVFPR